MRFKILDEVDDTPMLPYRPSITEQIQRQIAVGEELKDLMKKLGKDKDDDKKDKSKGLSAKQIALWLFITWPLVGYIGSELIYRTLINIHLMQAMPK